MGLQNHFERTRALVSRQTGVPEGEITPETRLAEDLGVAGSDGEALLVTFGDEFGVDVSQVASINYFDAKGALSPTGDCALLPVAAWLNPGFGAFVRHAVRGRRVVRVRDLVASARAGRWLRPPVRRTPADPTDFSMSACLALGGGTALPALAALWDRGAAGDTLLGAGRLGLVVAGAVWGALLFRFVLTTRWLRRLDAAATAEEAAGLTEAD